MFKSQKGITLVALVITIIVMLILAGVSISLLLEDDGVINKALTVKEEQIKASLREAVALGNADMMMEYHMDKTKYLNNFYDVDDDGNKVLSEEKAFAYFTEKLNENFSYKNAFIYKDPDGFGFVCYNQDGGNAVTDKTIAVGITLDSTKFGNDFVEAKINTNVLGD